MLDQSGKLSSWSKNLSITFELKNTGNIDGYVRYATCDKISKSNDVSLQTSSSGETDESSGTEDENESTSGETIRKRRSDEPADRGAFGSLNEQLHADKERVYPHGKLMLQFSVFDFVKSYRFGTHRVMMTLTNSTTYTMMFDDSSRDEFVKFFSESVHNKLLAFMFKRMEETGLFRRQPSVRNFLQQQNLWENSPTIKRYAKAILDSGTTFKDKIVLDVIIGLPILSIVAVHAGASQVYAIAKNFLMGKEAQTLINDNLDVNERQKIEIIVGSIEFIQLRQKVDIVLTEPVGITRYVQQLRQINKPAYSKWLKENGIIFPTSTYFYVAPFQDDQYDEKCQKQLTFWQQNINTLRLKSMVEFVITDTLDEEIATLSELENLIADPYKIRVNNTDNLTNEALKRIEFPIEFKIKSGTKIHGLVLWVDASFGNDSRLTEKNDKLHPSRIVFRKPLPVTNNRVMKGKLVLEQNADFETRILHQFTMTIHFVNLNETYRVDLENSPY